MAAVLVCGICIGASAAGSSQQITATIEPELTVTFDGIDQDFFDANGNRVYPILYNGSTYLPMRAVCEQLAGFDVSWDQATRTAAIISAPADGVDLLDTHKAYFLTSSYYSDLVASQVMSSDNKTADISGITVNHWLRCRVRTDTATNGKGLSALGSFNVEGKYDTVTFRYYSNTDAILEVIGDNDSVLYKIEVPGGQVAQEVTVNLLKTNQLTFKFTHNVDQRGVSMDAYVFDARLK